jgi:demethylspheroidene O-methyltransferase
MAMRTGQVRSQGEIAAKLDHIGFDRIQTPKSFRPYVTSVVLARKPDFKSTV